MTLKVADVAEKAENVPAVEAILFDMITDGLVHAKIDSKQKMISFIESPQDSGDQYLDVVSQLETQNKRIVALAQKVQAVDQSIKMSQKFIKKELNAGGGSIGSSYV